MKQHRKVVVVRIFCLLIEMQGRRGHKEMGARLEPKLRDIVNHGDEMGF